MLKISDEVGVEYAKWLLSAKVTDPQQQLVCMIIEAGTHQLIHVHLPHQRCTPIQERLRTQHSQAPQAIFNTAMPRASLLT